MTITIDKIKRDAIEDNMTSFILMIHDNGLGMMPFKPSSAQEQHMMLAMARHLVRQRKTAEAWFVFEAWRVATNNLPRRSLPMDLGDHPDKQEVLVCQHEHIETGRTVWIFDIVRDEAGKICELRDPYTDKGPPQEMEFNLWVLINPAAAH